MSQLVLFTDFGTHGPYVGQMKSRLYVDAPLVPQVDLLNDAPAFDARASSYLLAAYAPFFPADAVFLAVVDPGVGSHRRAVVLTAAQQRFIGPDNGLLVQVARQSQHLGQHTTLSEITWQPDQLSASFHGRDLFAPLAARLATRHCLPVGGELPLPLEQLLGFTDHQRFPDQLAEVIYLDPYGNAVTGLTAAHLPQPWSLEVAGATVPRARTFADVAIGSLFCYENANGLVELAVNQGSAAKDFGLKPGAPVGVQCP